MKQSKMTDAEYAAALRNVDAKWQAKDSLCNAHERAAAEWYDAMQSLRPETQAREIDRLVAEQLALPSEATP